MLDKVHLLDTNREFQLHRYGNGIQLVRSNKRGVENAKY